MDQQTPNPEPGFIVGQMVGIKASSHTALSRGPYKITKIEGQWAIARNHKGDVFSLALKHLEPFKNPSPTAPVVHPDDVIVKGADVKDQWDKAVAGRAGPPRPRNLIVNEVDHDQEFVLPSGQGITLKPGEAILRESENIYHRGSMKDGKFVSTGRLFYSSKPGGILEPSPPLVYAHQQPDGSYPDTIDIERTRTLNIIARILATGKGKGGKFSAQLLAGSGKTLRRYTFLATELLRDMEINNLSVTPTPPPPKARTPEELAQGKILRPVVDDWIKLTPAGYARLALLNGSALIVRHVFGSTPTVSAVGGQPQTLYEVNLNEIAEIMDVMP